MIPVPPVRSLWKNRWRYGSPFRVSRVYGLRLANFQSYLERRKGAQEKINALPPEQKQRWQVLEKEGFAPANADVDSGLLTQLCASLRERAKNVSYSTEAGKGKNFWKQLETEADRESNSLLVKMAMQPAVLNMASAYLGEVPYLAAVEIYLSHGTENTGWQESQLWHCDYDDRKMIKLFIYCTDVNDEKDGEFTYIPKDLSKNVKNNFFPKRITDESMFEQVEKSKVQRVSGKAETAFYIDTRSCYHLGSRLATGHTRLAFSALYVTNTSLWPFENGIKIVDSLSKTERLVLQH
ncbi:hypothetical protein EXS70_00030 [Candidatus Peribacteria bacterium]|nr:hypothetical protein [Candidatus Peribacteria bacterium]